MQQANNLSMHCESTCASQTGVVLCAPYDLRTTFSTNVPEWPAVAPPRHDMWSHPCLRRSVRSNVATAYARAQLILNTCTCTEIHFRTRTALVLALHPPSPIQYLRVGFIQHQGPAARQGTCFVMASVSLCVAQRKYGQTSVHNSLTSPIFSEGAHHTTPLKHTCMHVATESE
jgi:hypothetical protein